MPDLPPDLLKHMLDTQGALGRIEKQGEINYSFLQGVNTKIDSHIKDNGAHGKRELEEQEEKAAKRSDRNWTTWLNLAIAIGTLGAFLFDARGCMGPQRVAHGIVGLAAEAKPGH